MLLTGMDDIAKAVIERAKRLCEVCGGHGVDLHHIISGNGKRTQHQNQYSVVLLCKGCHQGTYGVHNNRVLDIELKLQLQGKYKELGYTEKETRKLMGGRLYSLEDKESKV